MYPLVLFFQSFQKIKCFFFFKKLNVFFSKFLAKAGVQTVLCNGETGEFASLAMEERRLLVEFARESFPGEQ